MATTFETSITVQAVPLIPELPLKGEGARHTDRHSQAITSLGVGRGNRGARRHKQQPRTKMGGNPLKEQEVAR